jgi:hypothetical protein
MESRERVYRTLEFDHPDRVPRDLWVLPWANDHYPSELEAIQRDFPSDFDYAPTLLATPPATEGEAHTVGEYRDEWGCVFTIIQQGAIGEVKDPLIKDWDLDAGKVHFPTEWLSFDRKAVTDFCRTSRRFVRGGVGPRPFERLQFLRGSENLYIDIGTRNPGFLAFLARLHEFYKECLAKWAKTEVDAVGMLDDWGAQSALLISPKTWRELFKPLYRDYAAIAHEHGKKFFMHSDGHILDIYEDLIEIGVDALNSQVFCMGIDSLSRFRGRITFWGEIDRQHLLPHGTREEIFASVAEFQQKLSANGGVIAQCEFGLGAKPENVRAVYEAWDRYRY